MDGHPSFGAWLKERRKELDLTQFDLADRIGCSQDTIHKIEKDERRPSRQMAELLADYFDVPQPEREAFVLFARGLGLERNRSPRVAGANRVEGEPASAPAVIPNNLPAQLTSFVGRAIDLPRIRDMMLTSDVRLLTLTGPPGTGKTRLALRVAEELLKEWEFEDGIYFVNLAPIGDSALVLSEIAQTLDVVDSGTRSPLDTLRDFLKEKRLLLVLDNFEQIVEAAPRVAELLMSAPRLKMLVTSRVHLQVRGERNYPVPPLFVPDVQSDDLKYKSMPVEQLSQYEAVRLFIERAVAVKPDFSLTEENAQAVAAICYRLDGLPLAIELAAARIRLFSPQAMLPRLESRLKLLIGGGRDLSTRQQTLRSAIDWSYDLLNDWERQLFRRLAVFNGGFTLEAVERICDYDEGLRVDVFEGVEALLTGNLLQQREGRDGEPRFWMLETIHEYATEKLAGSGEVKPLQREQALYFMGLAEEAEPHLIGEMQQEWLDRLEDEYDNIRAALAWASEQAKAPDSGEAAEAVDVGLRISGAIWHFWGMKSLLTEGRAHLQRAISTAEAFEALPSTGLVGATGGRNKVKALNGAGNLAYSQGDTSAARAFSEAALALGRETSDKPSVDTSLSILGQIARLNGDYTAARSLLEESLTLAREAGDKRSISARLGSLGVISYDQGDYATAQALFEESLVLAREVGDKWSISNCLENLGNLTLEEGDYTATRALYEESLALRKELGNKEGLATSLNYLAIVALEEGNYTAAQALFEESLVLAREIGNKWEINYALKGMGRVALAEGDHAAARRLFEESLTLDREIDDGYMTIASLAWLGGVAVRAGQLDRGAKLLGAAGGLLQSMGVTLFREDRLPYERALSAARSQLEPEKFETAWGEGRSMSLEDATEYALKIRSVEL